MTTATSTPAALAPLFEPITLGNVEIRNRVVMTGHGTGMAKDYLPTDQHVAYYRERAMGGAGLIGMAFPQIHPTSQDVPGEPRSWLPEIVPGLHKITSAVHEYGARIVMQLGHGGRQGHSTFTERALWSPSNTPCPFNLEMPKEMEIEDIDEIIAAHAVGARHAKQGGMDGVEIHSGYGGYLLASFLSPFSNHRTDEYGGSLENRMRIVMRVIDAVRAEVGPDYLVGMNLQGHDFSPGGLEVERCPADCAGDRSDRQDRLHLRQSCDLQRGPPERARHAAPQADLGKPRRCNQIGRRHPGDRGRTHQRSR